MTLDTRKCVQAGHCSTFRDLIPHCVRVIQTNYQIIADKKRLWWEHFLGAENIQTYNAYFVSTSDLFVVVSHSLCVLEAKKKFKRISWPTRALSLPLFSVQTNFSTRRSFFGRSAIMWRTWQNNMPRTMRSSTNTQLIWFNQTISEGKKIISMQTHLSIELLCHFFWDAETMRPW